MSILLLIEDDNDLRGTLKELLQQEGYEIQEATSVDQAMTCLQTSQPQLVLLDIMLPGGKNGFDFLESIRKDPKTKDLPVIILSNLDSEKTVAEKIGIQGYFVKANTPLNTIVSAVKETVKK
ncbi:hypothetical protein C5B42_02800 [Candidatus Cerribacteria bacterium 'Amazon FNV 2010 28 9']|uniref:Response regulatory domain-containing protein n=1 Tax=Candidatus Cerribacteria bacterium 'Amazon FNV 2010 28 9' TaxID=2081795 RepID=A0A317JPW6_9BACT|nr:MAG: hypothetical protein C5B42_02800 [Candidatus Cerribacteria bacterium 'Amazon FNV 2010 28 9']